VPKNRNIISSFSYSNDDAALMDDFQKIADREHRKFSPMLVEVVRDYVKAHKNGNSQFTLEKSTEAGFTALPTLGEKNQRQKLEKLSDKDIVEILKASLTWSREAEAILKKRGWRESDMFHAKHPT